MSEAKPGYVNAFCPGCIQLVPAAGLGVVERAGLRWHSGCLDEHVSRGRPMDGLYSMLVQTISTIDRDNERLRAAAEAKPCRSE